MSQMEPGEFRRLLEQAIRWEPDTPSVGQLHAMVTARRRRRGAFAVAAAVVLVLAVAFGTGTLAAHRPNSSRQPASHHSARPQVHPSRHPRPTRHPHPRPHPRRSGPTAGASGALLSGRANPPVVAVPNGSTVLINMFVEPERGGPPISWSDSTRNAGRIWIAGHRASGADQPSAQWGMRFVTGSAGWAFGPDLYATTDAGRTWQRDPAPVYAVQSIAAAGNSSWIIALPCANERCAPVIYRATGVGGPLTRLPSQPTGTPVHLALTSASTAVAIVKPAHAPAALTRTTDGGVSWTEHALPCSAHSQAEDLSATGSAAVWLACLQPSGSTCGECAPDLVYTSTDGGVSWTAVTTVRTAPDGYLSIQPINARIAWAVNTEALGARVLRTDDGGHTWRDVKDNTSDDLTYVALAATSADDAWVTAQISPVGNHPTDVYRTTDAGRTWQPTHLPTPNH